MVRTADPTGSRLCGWGRLTVPPAPTRPVDTRRRSVTVGDAARLGRRGWDTPAHGLYPRLCRELRPLGLASLRVRFRDPTCLPAAVLDVLAAAAFLAGEGVTAVGLVGHSFGGAVVIRAAALVPAVRTV